MKYSTTMEVSAEFMLQEEKDKTVERIDALLEDLT